MVADESGSVMATLWNDVGAAVALGDIILMAGGYLDGRILDTNG